MKKLTLSVMMLAVAVCMTRNPAFAQGLTKTLAQGHFNEAVAKQKEGKLDEAKSIYQKVMLLDPHNRTLRLYCLNNLGIIQMKEGDLREAETTFLECVAFDPHYSPAHKNLALLYEKIGDDLSALRHWSEAFNVAELRPKGYVIEEGPEQLVPLGK
jgi:tetratricopeptide (TPR) repeat protein